jgi:nucleoside-diphosphate kinase
MAEPTMTFAIIKPDAVRAGNAGNIIQRINDNGFKIRAMKLIHMSKPVAEGFYDVHRARPFFGELVEFMTSEPVVVQVLEGEDAVKRNRDIMGATNPADAADGTIRKVHALSIGENSVHGSDSDENAAIEIKHFFNDDEIVG